MAIQRVNGIEFDGTTVTTTFGRHQIPALKTSYKDGLETADLVEMGSQEIAAITPGTYKRDDITITFRSSVFRAKLMPLFPKNGGGNVRIAIVVSISHPDLGSDSDLISQARCVNWSAATENSNKALEVETMWKCRQIYWTSQRKTINSLGGIVPLGASTF